MVRDVIYFMTLTRCLFVTCFILPCFDWGFIFLSFSFMSFTLPISVTHFILLYFLSISTGSYSWVYFIWSDCFRCFAFVYCWIHFERDGRGLLLKLIECEGLTLSNLPRWKEKESVKISILIAIDEINLFTFPIVTFQYILYIFTFNQS